MQTSLCSCRRLGITLGLGAAVLSTLLTGPVDGGPAGVAAEARSSKPKEIVVVGSKLDVVGDDQARLTTEEAAAATQVDYYLKIDSVDGESTRRADGLRYEWDFDAED